MLEIIALCSCACLACLWCVLAFEVARDKYCDSWTMLDKLCGRRCAKCRSVCRKRAARQTRALQERCKSFHSHLQPPCDTSPPYKLVCKMCRRVKAECICAKLFCHGMAINRSIKYQSADLSFR
ncbi:uncharacterized protein LOC116854079 isoform X2 [Odontomachus brunneus]|uniref:uncharacterized protein LOC116854079 isoform X2 n=1 Tax=Odontomachus brunneus TaxID=486640 RepID=UPI0013F1B944|nr:uncharacterized protein LOC116854079 isoform X2 [Odontomachus brunneus]